MKKRVFHSLILNRIARLENTYTNTARDLVYDHRAFPMSSSYERDLPASTVVSMSKNTNYKLKTFRRVGTQISL